MQRELSRRSSCFASLLFVVAVLAMAGCRDGVELGGVQGRVTQNGQSQAKLWVRFTPAMGGRPAEAVTNQDGRYELRYTGAKKGALLGQHKVTIFSGGEIDGRGNELTPRKQIFNTEVAVKRGSNTIDFDLSDRS